MLALHVAGVGVRLRLHAEGPQEGAQEAGAAQGLRRKERERRAYEHGHKKRSQMPKLTTWNAYPRGGS